jgi:transmembrane sensor
MIDDPEKPTDEQEALKREAREWVMRLTSGEATMKDAEALKRWRETSREHRRAFAEANLLWDKMRPAAAVSLRRNPLPMEPRGLDFRANRQLARRAFLGGAATAATAAAAYMIVRPPLDLWPSLAEAAADYRTGTGQQQQIAVIENISVKLNTRTSVALLPPENVADHADRIELIAGEAAVATTPQSGRSIIVVAAQGRTIATSARFNVRRDDAGVCVTCLEGEARVEHLGRVATVRPREQVVYTADTLGPVIAVDPEVVVAWERGLLVFRNDPLAHVIDEVNRYRPGRIILTNSELGRRPVLATFRIDRIDDVLPRLETVFGVRIRALPGGIALVG